jgi:PAS domain-containing protein
MQWYRGVIAQDLLAARSAAVVQADNGYLMVNYGLLDVEFRELTPAEVAAENRLRVERRRFVVAGDRRTYELIETPLVDGGGAKTADGVVGFARDVTDRDDAAGDLERHLNAQNEVLDQVQSAIAIFEPNKQLVFFNAAYAHLWRLDEDWLAAKPSHGDILERLREARRLPEQADFPAYKADVLGLYTSLMERREDQIHLPDGATLREVITPHPFGGLLFIYEDVSDRLELERARNTLIAVQRATLDHLFEGVAVFGPDGRLKLYNPVYARIWRLDPELLNREPHVAELTEVSRSLFFGDDVGPEADENWDKLKDIIVGGTLNRVAGVTTIHRADGSMLRHAAVPLPDGAMLHTYLDVTEIVD